METGCSIYNFDASSRVSGDLSEGVLKKRKIKYVFEMMPCPQGVQKQLYWHKLCCDTSHFLLPELAWDGRVLRWESNEMAITL